MAAMKEELLAMEEELATKNEHMTTMEVELSSRIQQLEVYNVLTLMVF